MSEELKKFLYSKKFEEDVKKQLQFAEKHGRITINEWRNFIDYDIINIVKFALEECPEKTDSEVKK